MIGTKMGAASLASIFADDKAAAAGLRQERWTKPYVRITYAPDKNAIKAAIASPSPHGAKLAAIGFSITPGVETFFVERVAQAGTLPA